MGNNRSLSSTTTTLLCVEGDDDRYMLKHFCRHLQMQHVEIWEVDTKSSKSYQKELQLLKNEPNFRNVRRLALMCDADGCNGEAQTLLRAALESEGLPAPAINEIYAENDTLRTGIYVMSGADGNGAIEELFFETLDNDPIMACVDGYFACLTQKSMPLPKRVSKARIQVYLAGAAGNRDIVRTLGLAARDGYWNFAHPKLNRLRNFLLEL